MLANTRPITIGREYYAVIGTRLATLSAEKVQLLSGLIFVIYSQDRQLLNRGISWELYGTSLRSEQIADTFTWDGDTIHYRKYADDGDVEGKYTTESSGVYTFQVIEHGEYVLLRSQNATISFKNGLLESIGDQPAVDVDGMKMWFCANTCYRASNPHLPAFTYGNWEIYYNSSGQIHRCLSQGPAIHNLDKSDELLPSAYYLNGMPQACVV